MTDKEKARNYYFSLREKNIEFNYENVRMCIIQAYIDGLTEGREEMKKEYKENAIPYVFELRDKVNDLEKENAKLRERVTDLNKPPLYDGYSLQKENKELKAQIEKMKCCENCRYNAGFDFSCNVVRASKYGATKDKNGEDCHNFDKWELSEGE